jgi:hypothetical protein
MEQTLHLFWQIPLAASLLFVAVALFFFRVGAPNVAKIDAHIALGGSRLWYIPRVVLYLLCAMAFVYDVLYNFTLGTILFLQLPISQNVDGNRWLVTFTERLQYIVSNQNFDGTRRRTLALPIARFTNMIDPNHIRM